MLRIVNVCLLIAALVVISILVWCQVDLRSLRAKEAELAQRTQLIEAPDAAKFYVKLVGQDGLNSLVWRVAFPEVNGLEIRIKFPRGQSSTSVPLNTLDNKQSDIRWGFGSEFRSRCFLMTPFSASSSSLSDDMASFLDEHWDDLNIEIAGEGEVAEYSTTEVVELLTVTAPPELLVSEQLSDYDKRSLQSPPVIKLMIGTNAAFQSYDVKAERAAER